MGRVYMRGKYWYVDYIADGKRQRKKHGKYKRLAELYLSDIELQVVREELKIPTDAAIDKFFENFMVYAEAHVSPKTLERYKTVVSNFQAFRSKFNSVNKLSKITPEFLEDFKLARAMKVEKSTVNHDLKILGIIFNRAVKQNLIKKNPAKEVERFKVEQKEVRFFSLEEIQKILESCSERMYPAYMILFHTGVRKGELLELEWDDVDFERRIIKIGPKDGWSPKGKRPREIPINDELIEVLLEQRRGSKGSYVLEKNGSNRYDRTLWEDIKKLTKELGIKDANIHTFRHTFASYMIMNGVDIVTVKELLGHSDITTTMRYAHLMPNHKMWAVNKLKSITRIGTNLAQTEDFKM
jgi:integrase